MLRRPHLVQRGAALALLAAAVVSVGCIPGKPGTATMGSTTTAAPDGWELVWNDEFDGDRLDPASWTADHSTFGDGNLELACLTPRPENLRVADGNLVITARREAAPYRCPGERRTTEFPNGRPYTSAMIRTRGNFATTYGRFEIRARLPRGTGLWPAFWLLSDDYRYGGDGRSGELDVMENIGSQPDRISGTIHYCYSCSGAAARQAFEYRYPAGSDAADGFHTYTMEWEPGAIRWYVDGNLYGTSDATSRPWTPPPGATFPAPFDHPHYLILNMAVGGRWPGSPTPETVMPADFTVDWVRVYQR